MSRAQRSVDLAVKDSASETILFDSGLEIEQSDARESRVATNNYRLYFAAEPEKTVAEIRATDQGSEIFIPGLRYEPKVFSCAEILQ